MFQAQSVCLFMQLPSAHQYTCSLLGIMKAIPPVKCVSSRTIVDSDKPEKCSLKLLYAYLFINMYILTYTLSCNAIYAKGLVHDNLLNYNITLC